MNSELRKIKALDGVPTDGKHPNDIVIMTTDRKILALIQAEQDKLLQKVESEVIGKNEPKYKALKQISVSQRVARNNFRMKQRHALKKLKALQATESNK